MQEQIHCAAHSVRLGVICVQEVSTRVDAKAPLCLRGVDPCRAVSLGAEYPNYTKSGIANAMRTTCDEFVNVR
jgi:hypothetical protein